MSDRPRNPSIGQLYVKMTDPTVGRSVTLPGVLDMIGKLSVTSQFKLSLHLSTSGTPTSLMNHLSSTGVLDDVVQAATYDFLCSDASLPGISLNLSQEMGSHQGVIEKFPNSRIFPSMDVTFYVDSEFKVIRLFEEWINYINPIHSFSGKAVPNRQGLPEYNARSNFFRLRYPNEYKTIISITKFERNFRVQGTNKLRQPHSVTYRLIDAFPSIVNSIPVTYEGSTITKTTVSFEYSRYVMEVYRGEDNDT